MTLGWFDLFWGQRWRERKNGCTEIENMKFIASSVVTGGKTGLPQYKHQHAHTHLDSEPNKQILYTGMFGLTNYFCVADLIGLLNHLALRGITIQSRQYIFFDSCMRFQFQGASVCLLVLIRHDGRAIRWVYHFGSACRHFLVFWLLSPLYNLEMATHHSQMFHYLCFIFKGSGAFCLYICKD